MDSALSPGKIMSLSPASVQKSRTWTESWEQGSRWHRPDLGHVYLFLLLHMTVAERSQRKKDVKCWCSYQSRSQQGRGTRSVRSRTQESLGSTGHKIRRKDFLRGGLQSCLSLCAHTSKGKRHSRPCSCFVLRKKNTFWLFFFSEIEYST